MDEGGWGDGESKCKNKERAGNDTTSRFGCKTAPRLMRDDCRVAVILRRRDSLGGKWEERGGEKADEKDECRAR